MWKATRISADAAQKMQMNAGLLLRSFDVNSPVEPEDQDIVCETRGDFTISCIPEIRDFFEDVNNAPTNTKEGKQITGWNCTLGVTALSVTLDTLALALGASETVGANGLRPRANYHLEDFKSLYWIGDMMDEDKLFVVVMDDTVSTGGVSFTSTNRNKGGLALTLTAHSSLDKPEVIPMAFYILEKVENVQPNTGAQ